MNIKLYGVMGSISGGSSDLGKNTTSIHLSSGENEVLVDSGTGILNYFNNVKKRDFTILFTHYHLDHVMGFPFIPQLFDDTCTFNIYGPDINNLSVGEVLKSLFKKPFLPFSYESIKATIHFHTVQNDEPFILEGFEITPFVVDHPGGSMTYCFNDSDTKTCILTDLPNEMEHNKSFINFCKSSDLLYADAYFTSNDLKNHQNANYGHATIESVIAIKDMSNSNKLILGHHKSSRTVTDLELYVKKDIMIGIENKVYCT